MKRTKRPSHGPSRRLISLPKVDLTVQVGDPKVDAQPCFLPLLLLLGGLWGGSRALRGGWNGGGFGGWGPGAGFGPGPGAGAGPGWMGGPGMGGPGMWGRPGAPWGGPGMGGPGWGGPGGWFGF
ncbi:hypothetical protein [Alicyclobacillus sp.]|uniref:hypothetical protein n=1 Tax=Alicyclobacillus sp. TaxID=61169 RepID=UPI0025C34FE8|nr:hypothetical protein [Alicyclobacillus sp.]MCL6517189.1 hypothetical protein [Alicyclobacillus sp.]